MFPRHLHTWFRTALGSSAVRRNDSAAAPVARFTAAALLAAMLAVPAMATGTALADSSAGSASGLVVSPTDITIEEGERGKISVALKTQPTGLVTVRISRNSVDGFAMDRQRMQFTPNTWDKPQSVWLRARMDDGATDETTIFTFTPRGGGYSGIAPVTVRARVKDYEGHAGDRGLLISPTEITVEEGDRGKISVVLKRRPKGMVAVHISQKPAGVFAASRKIMRFTTETWNRPQLLWLQAREDDDAKDETTVFTFAPRHGGYNGLAPVTVTAGVEDNDEVPASSESYPTVSVADASADEGNASGDIFFEVSLSEPAERLAAVDFRTVPGGTATVGADYRNEWYTVFIPAGRTSALAGVQIFDDDIDDDGETLIVEISNARLVTWGAGRWPRLDIETSRAIGTIRNSDPLPKDWLARFGRTVAEQVLESVETRTRAPRAPRATGAALTLAGQQAGGAAAQHELVRAQAEGGLADRLRIQSDFDRMHGLSARTATGRELLTGSSFALAGRAQGTGFYTLWGRGAATHFDGREGGLSLDGEVTSGMLGADWTRGAITAGLVVSRSRGEGSYRGEAGGGAITSSLTGAFPWGGYALSERLSVWGVTGFGQGRLTLTPEGQAPIETDLDLAMAAAGLRSVLAEAPETGGIELALKSDALGVRTGTASARGLEAAETEATRLRLGLEGSRPLPFEGGARLTPSVEIGARLDGGDAETGFGVEIGGGLAWSDPRSGLSAELRGRGLLSHAAEGFRSSGVSGSLSWDPTPAMERGLELTMRQTVGAQPASGVDAIFKHGTLAGLAAGGIGGDGDTLAQRRFEIRLGYCLAALGNGFTSKPELGFGLSNGQRDYSVGWRLTREGRYGGSLGLSLEASLREGANDNANPEHAIGTRLSARF